MRVIIVGDTGTKDAVIAAPFTDDGTPILYVKKDSIPDSIWDELERLDPDEILVFGGTARVSAEVESKLRTIAPTTRIAGASVFGTSVAASQELYPLAPVDPPVEPPVEPPVDPPVDPPTGMYIPKLQGPILSHDGNPKILGSMVFRDGQIHNFDNVLIRGSIRAYSGSVINITNSELDGSGGQYCAAGWGGIINLKRCEVWNAEDGLKDSVNTEQVTIHRLFDDQANPHGDCVQLQSSGSKALHQWSYFSAYYQNGVMANAAFIVKNDLGNGALQEITVEDSYIDGGNYCVMLKNGNAAGGTGKAPKVSNFRRVLFGGHARWGTRLSDGGPWDHRRNTDANGVVDYSNLDFSLSSHSPAPSTWDVSHI